MPDTPVNQLFGRYFHQRSPRTRVVLSQLPFTVTYTIALALIAALTPALLQNPLLITSIWITACLFLACIAVPWEKLPAASYLVIPYLDFVVVAFFREGTQALLASSGMLALFPVLWICASGFAPKLAVVASTFAAIVIVWLPVLLSDEMVLSALLGRLLFPCIVLGLAVAVSVLTTSMDKQRIHLEAKDRMLTAALTKSTKNEQLLAAIMDTVDVGLVVVDNEGNDRLMNATQSSTHALGIPADIADPEESELLLFSINKVPLDGDARPVRRAINGETFTNYQIWIGEGEDARALSTTARTVRNADGTADGAVIAFHDVTDMVNALAAKDDFVANVSHEFRTPLTAIQAYLALALETPGLAPQEIVRYLAIAERNADRLGTLVSDLLATASITLERTPINFSRLLQESLASGAPTAKANGVVVDWHCDDQLMVMGDGVRLGQVLDNLISNAVKYSPDGGTLTIRAWAEGTDLHCRVSDTGIGMSASEQGGLFQKFYRAGTARGRGIPGIGLGLMITKAIINNHGGSISVESEMGVGTTMGFVIPASVIPAVTVPAGTVESEGALFGELQ